MRFRKPQAAPSAAAPVAGPSAAPVAPRPAPRILVADDSAVTRRVLRALVSTIDPAAEVLEAGDAASAGTAIAAAGLDLAFVDVGMPGLSAQDAVAATRRGDRDPLIVLMGEVSDEGGRDLARDAHAYDFVEKPIEERDLRRIMTARARMGEPCRALVVDDSKVSRRLMTKVLGASRFALAVETADGGEAALKVVEAGGADVLFLDYNMPGLDGLETACLAQEIAPGLPVVMVSSSRNPAVATAARYFGAVHFLRKPFYAREVDRAMHLALGLPLPSTLVDPAPEPEPDDEEMCLAAAIPAAVAG